MHAGNRTLKNPAQCVRVRPGSFPIQCLAKVTEFYKSKIRKKTTMDFFLLENRRKRCASAEQSAFVTHIPDTFARGITDISLRKFARTRLPGR